MADQRERAGRAWPILTSVASRHTSITYGELAGRIGLSHHRPIRYVLGEIQDYCTDRGLPPLTIVVVHKEDRRPGEGFIGWNRPLNERYGAVYAHRWADEQNPFTTRGADRRATTRSYWTLASHPNRYRVLDGVREEEDAWWLNGRSHLRAGDRVAIWKYKGTERYRGIVAFGEVLTDPEIRPESEAESPYWVGREPKTNMARVRVRYVRKLLDQPLWLETSPPDSVIRELNVAETQGGTTHRVTSDQWDRLMDLIGGWPSDELALAQTEAAIDAIVNGRDGQGFGGTAAENRAVELYAMQRVIEHYARWVLDNVSDRKLGYDLEARNGSIVQHIEVKGSRGGPDGVILTANEVRWARANPDTAVLAVVHGILLDASADPPLASGGTVQRLSPWLISDDDLTSIAFFYRPPFGRGA